MTDLVSPSFGSTARSRTVAAAIKYSGGSQDGWVQPSSSRLVPDPEGNLATGALSAFSESHSGSSLDITINSGEGLVGGAYLARDTNTTVTLASSTNNQSIYVGWEDGVEDSVIIGLSSDFTSDDPKMEIWQADTDSNGVTSTSDQRNLDNYRVKNENVEALQNFTSDETFSGHPISLAADTDMDLGSTDLVDGGTTIWDSANGEIENAVVDGLTNLSDGDKFSSYPLGTSDYSDSSVTRPKLDSTAKEPIYGDGSDGSITRSSDANENGILYTTDYTLQSGTTMTVTTGWCVIFSQGTVTIDGTFDLSGEGGSGGAGGTDNVDANGGNGNGGGSGGAASFIPDGAGGSGGTGGDSVRLGGDGGSGGDGDTASPKNKDLIRALPLEAVYEMNAAGTAVGAGGGGGGGGGNDGNAGSGDSGNSGSPPGGGGGGSTGTTDASGGHGGDGGDGGGGLFIIANKITGSGTIDVSGVDGGNGNTSNSGGSGGGGGGGGNGGLIFYMGPDITRSGITETTSAGSGGVGNSGAGDGADGDAGQVIEVST